MSKTQVIASKGRSSEFTIKSRYKPKASRLINFDNPDNPRDRSIVNKKSESALRARVDD